MRIIHTRRLLRVVIIIHLKAYTHQVYSSSMYVPARGGIYFYNAIYYCRCACLLAQCYFYFRIIQRQFLHIYCIITQVQFVQLQLQVFQLYAKQYFIQAVVVVECDTLHMCIIRYQLKLCFSSIWRLWRQVRSVLRKGRRQPRHIQIAYMKNHFVQIQLFHIQVQVVQVHRQACPACVVVHPHMYIIQLHPVHVYT